MNDSSTICDSRESLPNDPITLRRGRSGDAVDAVGAAGASVHRSILPTASVGDPRNIHLLHAGAILFLVPNALIAVHLGGWARAVVLAGCALALLALARTAPRGRDGLLAAPIDFRALLGCAALAVALCLLGGETHLFYANSDWLVRDAVLADLVRQGFPTFYHYQDQDYLLRAPLGMYMAPALVGRLIGLHAAHVALLAQNSAILALSLYFFSRLARVNRFAFLALFVAFSGLDIVGTLINALADFARSGKFVAPEGVDGWNKYLHFSSHINQIFWTPNHLLPGWWLAVLALLHARREVDLATLLLSLAALAFWSPLAALGGAPFVVYFALRSPLKELLTPHNLHAVGACLLFLPVAIYLIWDANSVAHGWLLGAEGFALAYVSFVALSFPHAAIVASAWDKVERGDRAIFVIAVAVLLLLPFYWFGQNNDLVSRASIPAYAILAFAFARVATLVPRDNGRLATCISVIVILSAAGPMVEIKRSLFVNAYGISDCNLLTSWRQSDPTTTPTNYLARASNMPRWLVPMNDKRLALEDRACWPDNTPMGAVQR